jgi:hypothetical protein
LFITVTDQATGKSFYEIYLRRQKDETEEVIDDSASSSVDPAIKGLNSYCLVAREEIPS